MPPPARRLFRASSSFWQSATLPLASLPGEQTGKPRAEELTCTIGAHEGRVCLDLPADAAEDADGDHQGHRQVDRKEPLEGEPPHPTPPAAERQVDEENERRQDGKAHGSLIYPSEHGNAIDLRRFLADTWTNTRPGDRFPEGTRSFPGPRRICPPTAALLCLSDPPDVPL